MSKHGLSNTRLYNIWRDMKNRCLNPNNVGYPNYGGRGITVCAEWLEYQPFHDWAYTNGYMDDLFIDREDNNLGYSPANCRFVTRQVQQANRRSFKNSTSAYLGVYRMTATKWAAKVTQGGKNKHLGRFNTELEAAKARDDYIKLHRLPLRLNLG